MAEPPWMRLTNSSRFAWDFQVLTLEISRSGHPLCPGQTGTADHPTLDQFGGSATLVPGTTYQLVFSTREINLSF